MFVSALIGIAVAQSPTSTDVLHPRDSVLFVALPEVAATLQAYERAPLVQMMRDPDVLASVAKLEQALGVDLTQGLDQTLADLGIPTSQESRGIDAAIAPLRTLRSLSLSLSVHEDRPGEIRAALERMARTQRELLDIEEAIDQFDAQHSVLPKSLSELALPSELSQDEWGRGYRFDAAEDGTYQLRSLGSDGAVGGEGEAIDVGADFDQADWLADEMRRRWSLLVVAECTSAQSAEQALAFAQGAMRCTFDGEARTVKFRGASAEQRAFHTQLPFEVSGWSVRDGEWVLLGLGREQVDSVLARAVPSTNAANSQTHRVERSGGAVSGPVIARGATNTRLLSDLLDGLELGALSAGLSNVLNSSATACEFRMQISGERFITDIVTLGASEASWTSAIGNAPAPKASLAFVPGDAAGAIVAHVDGSALHRQFVAALGFDSDASARDSFEQLQSKHGFDLERDVFGNLAGGMSMHVMPISTLGAPNVVLSFELADRAAFEKGIRGLVAALEESNASGVQVRASEYRKIPTWEFKSPDEQPSPVSISPTLALVGNRALITLTSLFAKREIKRLAGEEPSAPHALAARTDIPPEAGVVGSMDWSAMLASVYKAARGALALAGGMVDLPIDMGQLTAALPEKPETFTRFFKPTLLWGRAIDGAYHVHWEASFGPETWTGLVALGAAGVSAFRTNLEDARTEAVEPDATRSAELDATRAALELLSSRLAVFKIDQGHFPPTLDTLSKPTASYPDGFLDGLPVPLDGWSRAFAFERGADGETYRLWSFGSDGVDARGAGDDVIAP
ncbi:MAG: type II secretion system protein GspG [Planctomycetes bacterium]|nr:type II secretion system protein GspG [Planctomycetota bacterium]